RFSALRADARSRINDTDLLKTIEDVFKAIDKDFVAGLNAEQVFVQADENARRARRPLDEKKLLDMLVDEIEDKLIEQIEGTRAHTANVDNYLRAVTTALD